MAGGAVVILHQIRDGKPSGKHWLEQRESVPPWCPIDGRD
jgi:hypothetical protein